MKKTGFQDCYSRTWIQFLSDLSCDGICTR